MEKIVDEGKLNPGCITIETDWGYYCYNKNETFIPAIVPGFKLRDILKQTFEKTGNKKIIFTAVLWPEKLKVHLKNIKREWDDWFPEANDYTHCIEIEYVED